MLPYCYISVNSTRTSMFKLYAHVYSCASVVTLMLLPSSSSSSLALSHIFALYLTLNVYFHSVYSLFHSNCRSFFSHSSILEACYVHVFVVFANFIFFLIFFCSRTTIIPSFVCNHLTLLRLPMFSFFNSFYPTFMSLLPLLLLCYYY